MNIVINALSAKLGGGQTYLKQLLKRLPENRDLTILLYAPDSLSLPTDGRIRRGRTSWPTNNPILRAIWERFALPRILRRERADILFCPGGVVATQAPPSCKTVTMFRNMIPFTPRIVSAMPWGLQRWRNIILKRVMLKSMAQADLTIFISDFARATIEALAKIPHPITIPHGISPDFRTAGRNLPRPASAPEQPYLLYVSRIDSYKHHVEVVTAFASLPPHLRSNLKLVLVGETDSVETVELSDTIRLLGVGDNVVLTGPVKYDDLPGWYHNAVASIFASSCENCPNILLEALGSGRPVVCSDVMPMPEFGGNGLIYFSPFDPSSLATALGAILDDPDAASQCTNAALERSRHFDWSTTAERTWHAIGALVRPESTHNLSDRRLGRKHRHS